MDNVSQGSSGDSLLATSRGGLVSARGTSEGVVLRLDGRVAGEDLKVALAEFMQPRKTFLGGQEVSLEWIGVRPVPALVDEVTALLDEQFKVSVRGSQVRDVSLKSRSSVAQDVARDSSAIVARLPERDVASSAKRAIGSASGSKRADAPVDEPPGDFSSDDDLADLFSGIDDFDPDSDLDAEPASHNKNVDSRSISLADPTLWDDPDARIIYSTLRSGQRIESEHSLIIVGDINPGAEVVAGGDVIVLGSLRGIAHAGAYEESGGGRSIFALALQPTQLRIGTTISRGSAEGGKMAEIARIEGNAIVVEPFMKKSAPKRW